MKKFITAIVIMIMTVTCVAQDEVTSYEEFDDQAIEQYLQRKQQLIDQTSNNVDTLKMTVVELQMEVDRLTEAVNIYKNQFEEENQDNEDDDDDFQIFLIIFVVCALFIILY